MNQGTTRPVRRQASGNLAWIDLEMTGLDPASDVILQAALIVTTAELEPLEEFSCDVWQPEPALASMVPFVRDMHEKTGLLSRVRASRTVTVARLMFLCVSVMSFVPATSARHANGPLSCAGFSVVDPSSLYTKVSV